MVKMFNEQKRQKNQGGRNIDRRKFTDAYPLHLFLM